MTQEEKDLLLKDLCARLPYGVKISVPELWTNKEKIETLNEIFKGDDDLYRVNDSGILIKYIKPYLFPLSSMTEEQKEDMVKSSCGIGSDKNVFDWYNKNHFDYRGLIPMGLAIDATNKNIYQDMKHTYTEEEKERIAQMLFDFLREHRCFGGEHFAQDDECQIDSIDFMCDLADIKDVTEDLYN